MEEASGPSPVATAALSEDSFATWQQEQHARVSSQRCYHFYTAFCYYYAMYAHYPWPRPVSGGEQQQPVVSAEEQIVNQLRHHFTVADQQRGPDAPAPRIAVHVRTQAGVYVTPAPVTLRLFAELLDFLLIYLLKDVVYSILGMDGPELVLEQLDNSLKDSNSAPNVVVVRNFDQVIKYTVFYRLMVMVYETLFLAYGLQGFGGATIGKRLVGLSVIHCTHATVTSPSGRTVFVSPGGNLGFWRSFIRSMFKVTVLFVAYPIMIGILFQSSGQTVYDQVSGSVVVVTRRVPVPEGRAAPGGRARNNAPQPAQQQAQPQMPQPVPQHQQQQPWYNQQQLPQQQQQAQQQAAPPAALPLPAGQPGPEGARQRR